MPGSKSEEEALLDEIEIRVLRDMNPCLPTVSLPFGGTITIRQVHGGVTVRVEGEDAPVVFSDWASMLQFLSTIARFVRPPDQEQT